MNRKRGHTSPRLQHDRVDAARNPGILDAMAHVVGGLRPDVVLCRDVSAGPAMLFDLRSYVSADLSETATAVIENDSSLRQAALERAVASGVKSAATEVELVVQMHLDSEPSERWAAEREVLEALSEIVVRAWLEEQERPQQ